MIYPIECNNFIQVALVSKKFGELYSKEEKYKISGRDGAIRVHAGEHLFIFYSRSKAKYENSIKVEDFAKKYFTPKSQVL